MSTTADSPGMSRTAHFTGSAQSSKGATGSSRMMSVPRPVFSTVTWIISESPGMMLTLSIGPVAFTPKAIVMFKGIVLTRVVGDMVDVARTWTT